MTPDNRRANALEEAERARRSLQSADVLHAAGMWEDCVSRAYYAAFHAVRALLFTKGLQARSHAGVQHLLWRHFVEAGGVPRDLHQTVSRLQALRERADYDAAPLSSAHAEAAVADARRVVDAIEAQLPDGAGIDGSGIP